MGRIAVAVVVVSKVVDRYPRPGASVPQDSRTGSLVPAFLRVRRRKTRKNNDDGDDRDSRDGSRCIDSTLARPGSVPKWRGSRRSPAEQSTSRWPNLQSS